jgi:hypothetical protein
MENHTLGNKFDLEKINKCLTKIRTKQKEYEQLAGDRIGSPYKLSEILSSIETAYDGISLECRIPQLESWITSEREKLHRELSETSIQFGKSLRQALPSAFDFSGNFPEFTTKFFLIKVDMPGKRVELYYGNQEERLSSISPIDAKTTAKKIQIEYSRITKKRFQSEYEFLKRILDSYKRLLNVKGASFGENVAITSILKELTVSMQKRSFWANPRQRFFTEYTREEFSYDLSRLSDSSQRTFEGNSLQLGVATRQDDKNPLSYLWIPVGETMKGSVYSTLSFKRMENEST